MITNKKELILAAQKFALETLAEADDHKRGKLRHDAFAELGIAGKHYDEFRQMCEGSRITYVSGEQNKLEAATE